MASADAVKAVFLDRDGVLNVDHGYVHKPEDLQLLPGVPTALAALRAAGFQLIVVTNQSGVARGFYDVEAVHAFHAAMQTELGAGGVQLDAFYICPHLDGCDCRKPKPGMVLQAARELGIDLSASYLIGDKVSDVVCAVAAGVSPVQIKREGERRHPGALALCDDLTAATAFITSQA